MREMSILFSTYRRSTGSQNRTAILPLEMQQSTTSAAVDITVDSGHYFHKSSNTLMISIFHVVYK